MNETLEQKTSGEKEFGLLIYDIPTNKKSMYSQMASITHGYGVFLNLSCYVIRWEHRQAVEDKIKKLQNKAGAEITCYFIKMDGNKAQEIALDAFKNSCKKLLKLIHKKHDNLITGQEDEKFQVWHESKRKQIKSLEAILFMFEMDTNDYLIEMIKKLREVLSRREVSKNTKQLEISVEGD